MPVFILATYPDGKTVFVNRHFTNRVPALEYIRSQLRLKSLMASAATYRIYNAEDCETFSEAFPPEPKG